MSSSSLPASCGPAPTTCSARGSDTLLTDTALAGAHGRRGRDRLRPGGTPVSADRDALGAAASRTTRSWAPSWPTSSRWPTARPPTNRGRSRGAAELADPVEVAHGCNASANSWLPSTTNESTRCYPTRRRPPYASVPPRVERRGAARPHCVGQPLACLQRRRRRRHCDALDVNARLDVPAHAPVLFPFITPAWIDSTTLAKLQRLFAGTDSARLPADPHLMVRRMSCGSRPESPQPFRDLTEVVGLTSRRSRAIIRRPPLPGDRSRMRPSRHAP